MSEPENAPQATSRLEQEKNEPFDEAKSQIDYLKSDLSQLRNDLKELTEDIAGLGKSSADGAKEAVTTSAQHWMDKLQTQAAESPVKTLGIAFGVGFILAKLTKS
jgi:ElaB/YqjD/DUF883 family membrane-anchored ribosome-binding protein